MKKTLFLWICIAVSSYCLAQPAPFKPSVSVELNGQAGTGSYSPFWLMSNRHGLGSIQTTNGYVRGAVTQDHSPEKKRFSYAYGLDLVGAYHNTSHFIIQQAYVDLRYRSLFLTVGSKEQVTTFKNPLLSTGDYTWSGNARPIPQVRAGFHDWVYPFKQARWFALMGNISWGWFTENNYVNEAGNKHNGRITTGTLYHHKAIYFKFLEDNKPFQIEAGFVIDQQFGGKKSTYRGDSLFKVEQAESGLKAYLKAFVPMQGGSTFYEGNYLGNWFIKGSYKLTKDQTVSLNVETIYEDASSLAHANRFDGSYTLEYKDKRKRIISGAVLEYFQSTDQSGPVHLYWRPEDDGITTNIKDYANGVDDNFNHYFYNSWSHWGMTIGNPLILSPLYNKDGYLGMKNNRVKAVHGGVSGWIVPELEHRILLTYMKGWGRHSVPFYNTRDNISALIEVKYSPKQLRHFSFKLATGVDTGNLMGDNWGVNVAILGKW